MNLQDLTPEQKEKALACKTPEELLALAEEEGYNISDEELQSIAGGSGWVQCDDGDPCIDDWQPPYC